jgi:DNA-binding NarL/FixJ family response regulator
MEGGRRRVLLADYAGPARRALAGLLRALDGVVLVGEVADRHELAAALRRTRADVLVIDDRLLSADDHVLARLGPQRLGVRIVVLGVVDDDGYAARAKRLGAEAWLAKDRAAESLPALLES